MSTTLDCTNPELNSVLNIASKDKFLMVLNLPYVLRKRSNNDPLLDVDNLQMTVFGTIVPEIRVPSTEVRYGSQSTNWSSYARPNYEPLSINFIVDNEFKNYYVLWKWLETMNLPRKGTYGGSTAQERSRDIQQLKTPSQAEYQTTLSIISLDEYNEPVIQFDYYNALITSLGSINHNYRDADYLETTALFSFGQLDIAYKKNNPKNIK